MPPPSSACSARTARQDDHLEDVDHIGVRRRAASPSKVSTRRGSAEVRKLIPVVIQESAADLFLSVVDNFATFGRFTAFQRAIHDRIEDVLVSSSFAGQPKVMDLAAGSDGFRS
jgi:hypothetical protein